MDWKIDKPDENKRRLLSVADVAEHCGVCQRTVSTWIAEEGLPVHRLRGRGSRGILRIAQDDLDAWLSQFRHNVTEENEHDDKTIRLDGRKFIAAGKSLGPRASPRSSVRATKDGGT